MFLQIACDRSSSCSQPIDVSSPSDRTYIADNPDELLHSYSMHGWYRQKIWSSIAEMMIQ